LHGQHLAELNESPAHIFNHLPEALGAGKLFARNPAGYRRPAVHSLMQKMKNGVPDERAKNISKPP